GECDDAARLVHPGADPLCIHRINRDRPYFPSPVLLRHLDLAAAAGAAHRGQRTLRHDDLRGGLAPQLLQLLHGALDRFLRELAEPLGGFLERAGGDFEADRQRAGGRQYLRLARIEDRACRIARAVFGHRGEPADRADAPVGEDLLEVERLRVDLDVARRLFSGSHPGILLLTPAAPNPVLTAVSWPRVATRAPTW